MKEIYLKDKIDELIAAINTDISNLQEDLANYIDSFASKAALDAYSGDLSNNDWAVVLDDETHSHQCWRYVYNAASTEWRAQFKINEEPMTQAQMDALNSGVTAAKVTSYDSHIANTNNPHGVTKAQLGLGNVDNTSDVNKPISQATQNALNEKLDKTKDIKKIEVVSELPKARDLYTMYLVVEEEEEWPGLKFTSHEDHSLVQYRISGTVNKDIYYSTDGKNWTAWNERSMLTLNNGQSIYVWNKVNTLSTSSVNYLYFQIGGSIAASGNVNSMINFSNITPYCYYSMFINCSSLTTAQELPATTLATYCYASMFAGCNNLITAPDLPATTLVDGCYYGMFNNCSILNSIKLYYTGNFDSKFIGWVSGVSSSGTLYYNGTDTTRGVSAIPQNWAVQTF